MNYEEAAGKLRELLAAASTEEDPSRVAEALETAGAIHTEALIASLTAYNAAMKLVDVSTGSNNPPASTPSGALLQPLPDKTADITLDFPLTEEQCVILKAPHLVPDGWDRWYAEFDGERLRYYRNASGFCFFAAKIDESENGYAVTEATVNQDDRQYSESNLTICAAQLKILLANDLGLDDEEYWDEMD